MKTRLEDVSYNKELNLNLMSLTRMLVNGWKVIPGNTNGVQIKD